MTTFAVLCDPPREGSVLTGLAGTTPLTEGEAADLYAAMCADVFRAIETSGGELLVNYRSEDNSPNEGGDAEAELRALAADALDQPDEVRYEVQVGSTLAGRVGNTVTHLLDTEEETSVVVVEPTAAFLTRGDLDGAAMKLRRSDVVLGPTAGGRVHLAGFADPIDFEGAYTPPTIGTLTDRALDAGLDVDYGPMLPVVETREDLVGALALIEARQRAGRVVPGHTAECIDRLGLGLADDGDGLALSRPDTDRD